ncbi:hypothetical protein [Endozoicomonas lisbonensis]|uniref:Uncharacterized protein n=1 Tax=Endozoicomonas lisbonensis TaxID=3120522 RepID=A0ABV2SPI7_9GAMM
MNALPSIPVAHSDSTPAMPEFAHETLDQYDLQLWHCLYDCPLHTWLSQARIKTGRGTVAIYSILFIEYRDASRASRYTEFSFSSLQEALAFRACQADRVELQGISPTMTRRYPIKT